MSTYLGALDPVDLGSQFNAVSFLVRQMIGRVCTATVVQVQAVNTTALTVDILPLVNQIDGNGNSTPHGTIHGVPYMRLQGGSSAVILDPVVDDLGIAVFADRDISAVKAAKKQSPPGSRRRHDWADALYIGGLLNGTPTQYVEFLPNGAGIGLISPQNVTLKAPSITMIGPVQVDGTLTATGDVQAGSISLINHVHSDPQGGNTGPATG